MPGKRDHTISVQCRHHRGLVDFDDQGTATAFRWRCTAPNCTPEVRCPKRYVKLHVFSLHGDDVGQMTTVCDETRPMADLVTSLPPRRVGHAGPDLVPKEETAGELPARS